MSHLGRWVVCSLVSIAAAGCGPGSDPDPVDGGTTTDGRIHDAHPAADAAQAPDGATSPDGALLPDGAPPADAAPGPDAAPACLPWSGQGSLQDAVNAHDCVEVQAGSYTLTSAVIMPTGHTLQGVGAAQSTLVASAQSWQPTCCDSVVASVSSTGVVVRELTIDCSGIATYGVAARGMTIENTVLTNGRCSGVGIAGLGMVIRGNTIENAAHTVTIPGRGSWNCASIAPGVDEGAGIYGEGAPDSYDPIIENNVIRDNIGPALDINGVWGGEFRSNDVYGNTAWAAVSLYGASNWTVEDNTISHPSDQPPQPYHPYCADGPSGGHSAGIFLCQDTDTNNLVTNGNVITGNDTSSFYGILSVGNDETQLYWAPRLNTFTQNNVFGSSVGCADDFQPGQWPSSDNVWTDNNCQGTPNTGPTYF